MYLDCDHEEGLGEESFREMFEEIEGYFESGREEEYSAYFDGECANLLSLMDEFILEEVADDGEEGNT